jgi:hypothetical protein
VAITSGGDLDRLGVNDVNGNWRGARGMRKGLEV